jgi:hypothetical protein
MKLRGVDGGGNNVVTSVPFCQKDNRYFIKVCQFYFFFLLENCGYDDITICFLFPAITMFMAQKMLLLKSAREIFCQNGNKVSQNERNLT